MGTTDSWHWLFLIKPPIQSLGCTCLFNTFTRTSRIRLFKACSVSTMCQDLCQAWAYKDEQTWTSWPLCQRPRQVWLNSLTVMASSSNEGKMSQWHFICLPGGRRLVLSPAKWGKQRAHRTVSPSKDPTALGNTGPSLWLATSPNLREFPVSRKQAQRFHSAGHVANSSLSL